MPKGRRFCKFETLAVILRRSYQVRSFKNLFGKWCARDSIMALVTTAMATPGENPVMATPKAVPLAGGCSVFVITIKKMEIPTARA